VIGGFARTEHGPCSGPWKRPLFRGGAGQREAERHLLALLWVGLEAGLWSRGCCWPCRPRLHAGPAKLQKKKKRRTN